MVAWHKSKWVLCPEQPANNAVEGLKPLVLRSSFFAVADLSSYPHSRRFSQDGAFAIIGKSTGAVPPSNAFTQTKTHHRFTKEKPLMPYITVGQENSANIDIYYEDLGTGQPDFSRQV